MKQQVIQNFLNLPGIVGVALIDGRSRPYFCGLDNNLNFQQQEALTQGIQQVVSTTPPEFESFAFRFSHHRAHIYKLTSGIILLVLTNGYLNLSKYQTVLQELKHTLQHEDAHSTLSTFRMLAGKTTLTGRQYLSPEQDETGSSPKADAAPGAQADADSAAQTTWQAVIDALNVLSEETARYLGKIVVANTWRSTRPDTAWPQAIKLDRNGHFALEHNGEIHADWPLDEQQAAIMQQWVKAFVTRCRRIIRDYEAMVLQQALTPSQRAALQLDIS